MNNNDWYVRIEFPVVGHHREVEISAPMSEAEATSYAARATERINDPSFTIIATQGENPAGWLERLAARFSEVRHALREQVKPVA